MKADVQTKLQDHLCGCCQSYHDRTDPDLPTLQKIQEIETRLSQGWRLHGDLQYLIHDIKYYLAQQSQ